LRYDEANLISYIHGIYVTVKQRIRLHPHAVFLFLYAVVNTPVVCCMCSDSSHVSNATFRTFTARPHSGMRWKLHHSLEWGDVTFRRTALWEAELCWRGSLQKLRNVQLLKLRWKRHPIKSRLCKSASTSASQSNRVGETHRRSFPHPPPSLNARRCVDGPLVSFFLTEDRC